MTINHHQSSGLIQLECGHTDQPGLWLLALHRSANDLYTFVAAPTRLVEKRGTIQVASGRQVLSSGSHPASGFHQDTQKG